MVIDLAKLLSNVEDKITIDEKITYNEDYLETSGIEKLENVNVSGVITKDSGDEVVIDFKVSGVMILPDSISLESVEYPFSFEIKGNLKDFYQNYENSLDIYEFLWENIVLEVPLKFSKVEDLSQFHGDGWKLISEEDNKTDNPFHDLLEKFKEE